jgi:hypothetical protein
VVHEWQVVASPSGAMLYPSNRLRKRVQPDTWSETLNERTSSVQFLLLQRTVHPHEGESLAFRVIVRRGPCWNWACPPLISDLGYLFPIFAARQSELRQQGEWLG